MIEIIFYASRVLPTGLHDDFDQLWVLTLETKQIQLSQGEESGVVNLQHVRKSLDRRVPFDFV